MNLTDDLIRQAREEAMAQGALEARVRCGEIIRSEAAKGRYEQAKVLAFDTGLSAEEAIKVLAAAPLDSEAATVPGMALASGSGAEAWAKALAKPQ